MPGNGNSKISSMVIGVLITTILSSLWICSPLVYAKKSKNKIDGSSTEIIKRSLLEKRENLEFSISRDIFSPDPMKPADPLEKPSKPLPLPPPPEKKEIPKVVVDEKEEIENEIRNSLFYEGYLLKRSNNYALVNLNGEFYAVTSGDIIQDRVKIANIQRKNITVEIKSYSFEIQLKGDDENEF